MTTQAEKNLEARRRLRELTRITNTRQLTAAEYREMRKLDARVQCFTAREWIALGEAEA